jgi:hypothetical protein
VPVVSARSYRVDFNAMTQTNTSTRMTRPIRRVQK